MFEEPSLNLCLLPITCLAYTSTLKMDAICFSDISMNLKRTTQRLSSEDSTFHTAACRPVTG
jgi:hypothetical protein